MAVLVGFSGSLRKGSFNAALLRAAGAMMPAGSRLEIMSIAGFPLYNGDDEACAEFGIEYATRQCTELLRHDAVGLHFYTLNKARSTAQVLRNLNLASHT